MSRKDDLKYFQDTMLLDKIALINSAMYKTADMMSSISGAVEQWGKDHIDTTSASTIFESLAKLAEVSVLTGVNPLIGAADAVIQELTGFSITSVIASILRSLYHKITSGESLTTNDINSAGISVLSSAPSLDILRQFEKTGQLVIMVKSAAGKDGWLGGFIRKMFGAGKLENKKGVFNLISGLAVWILKTVLKGAGLLALTGGVLGLVGLKNKKNQEGTNQETNETDLIHNVSNENIPYMPQPTANNFRSSGDGEQVHRNDQSTVWWVPINGSIQNTLMNWAINIYPELNGHQDEIKLNGSFMRLSNILASYIDKGFFEVPKGFTSIKQLIDAAISGLQIKKETNGAV